MGDETMMEWFREAFREIKADISNLRTALEKKSDDLASRAATARADIEAIKHDLDHGSRRITDIEVSVEGVSKRIGCIEGRCGSIITRDECEKNRSACAGQKVLAQNNLRNWVIAAIALSQLLLAALVVYLKLRGE